MCEQLAFKVIQLKRFTVNTINVRSEVFGICIGNPSFGKYLKIKSFTMEGFDIDYSFKLNTSCKEEIEQFLKEVETCWICLPCIFDSVNIECKLSYI